MHFIVTSDLKSKQRDCSLILEFDGDPISLTFDDAIEFKIQIAHVLGSELCNERKITSEAETWSAQIVPNLGGFGIAFEQSPSSTTKLWLNAEEGGRFSTALQQFIDVAGNRS